MGPDLGLDGPGPEVELALNESNIWALILEKLASFFLGLTGSISCSLTGLKNYPGINLGKASELFSYS